MPVPEGVVGLVACPQMVVFSKFPLKFQLTLVARLLNTADDSGVGGGDGSEQLGKRGCHRRHSGFDAVDAHHKIRVAHVTNVRAQRA